MSDEIHVEVEPWMGEVLGRAAERYPLVRIKLLRPTSTLPKYMTDGAAGADVFADFGGIVDPWLCGMTSIENEWGPGRRLMSVRLPQGTHRIQLGIALEIPEGLVGLLKGRSGLASKGNEGHVAAIDSDYRGEVCMLLHVGEAGAVIRHGDRVGQILFMPVGRASFELVDELGETVRAAGGFGSTGVR
jgi:dUTP pyrophosphatase